VLLHAQHCTSHGLQGLTPQEVTELLFPESTGGGSAGSSRRCARRPGDGDRYFATFERGCVVVRQDGCEADFMLLSVASGEAQLSFDPYDGAPLVVFRAAAAAVAAAAAGARRPEEVPPAMPPPGVAGASFRRRAIRCGSGDSARVWILDPGDDGTARRVLHILGILGAVRGDFASTFGIDSTPIGSGTTATVYKAKPLYNIIGAEGEAVREVAAKVYKACDGDEYAHSDKVPRDLGREVALLTDVQGHPNVVGFFGLFLLPEDDNLLDGVASAPPPRWCLTMELYPGDLYDKVKKARYLEAPAKPVIAGILAGLAHVHAKGVLHRDVKVENVMLRADGSPVLADFGLGCLLSDKQELLRACGSPGYVAPEVIDKEGFREQSDIFSIGVVLFFMLSGKLPFKGSDVMSTLRRTSRAVVNFEPYRQFEAVSDQGKDFIRLLLTRSPSQRPTAEEALLQSWVMPNEGGGAEQYPSREELPEICAWARPAQGNAKAALWQACGDAMPHLNSNDNAQAIQAALEVELSVPSEADSAGTAPVQSRARGWGRSFQRFGMTSSQVSSSSGRSSASSASSCMTPRTLMTLRGLRPAMFGGQSSGHNTPEPPLPPASPDQGAASVGELPVCLNNSAKSGGVAGTFQRRPSHDDGQASPPPPPPGSGSKPKWGIFKMQL